MCKRLVIYYHRALLLICLFLLHVYGAAAADWSYYGATQGGTKYSTIKQISKENVADLELAWVYQTGEIERRGEALSTMQSFESTGIQIAGQLVFCTALGRIIALDPVNGKERWVFDPNEKQQPDDTLSPKCRGVAQWQESTGVTEKLCSHRILYGSWDFRIFAIDARNGRPCSDFGDNGQISVDPGIELLMKGELQFGSPPAIVGDLAIFGSSIPDNLRVKAPSGKVRAVDVRSGEIRWEFDPIPRDINDPGADSWGGDSAQFTGHANVWTMMAVDEQRDLVFLPTSSPGPDFYGGLRPGENRYANSLVALRATSGEVVWHYQISHHDLWDYDLASQPILIDLKRDDELIPAVVQLTKQGFVFVFNRENGEPLFPIEERAVPTDGVEGEWVSPTQPYPLLPPPLVAQGMKPEDAWGFTPLDRWMCKRRIEQLRHSRAYTPPSLQGTILMPGAGGGANWGGGAWDPERNLMIVPTSHIAFIARLVPRAQSHGISYVDTKELNVGEGFVTMPQMGAPYVTEFEMLASPIGVPCTEPPWGRLTAVDLISGKIRWQVPFGTLEKLLPLPIPLEMGTPSAGGPIITAGGLVFIAASIDDHFRAFDIDTGEILWDYELPAGGQATPSTYEIDGKQYLVLAVGGHPFLRTTPGDYIMAFTLPDKPD